MSESDMTGNNCSVEVVCKDKYGNEKWRETTSIKVGEN